MASNPINSEDDEDVGEKSESINDSEIDRVRKLNPEKIILRKISLDKSQEVYDPVTNETILKHHDFLEFEKDEYDIQKLFGKRNLSLIDDDPTE